MSDVIWARNVKCCTSGEWALDGLLLDVDDSFTPYVPAAELEALKAREAKLLEENQELFDRLSDMVEQVKL
ncbi:hypothetical protein [Denitrobaculum tricleocarpae]|uniref:Uncharacterized protein n=1 Tax=Denitrobaculum tricleocarpae TaxID=2591009 RepID=A0A545TT10_9PROT|nr:hypothetical protein [Denitrobaculum tricleocarpae]TQV80357.1 hypothetical protein FKG95_09180 [Denitrobaculum tricleocarpae]